SLQQLRYINRKGLSLHPPSRYYFTITKLTVTLPRLDTVGDLESVLATPTGYPFIQVFYNATLSKGGTTAMTAIMIVLATANGMTNMATASRQLFAFARDKGIPFHEWFQKVYGWDIPLNGMPPLPPLFFL